MATDCGLIFRYPASEAAGDILRADIWIYRQTSGVTVEKRLDKTGEAKRYYSRFPLTLATALAGR